jgi:glucose/arabinose dehydrogenase
MKVISFLILFTAALAPAQTPDIRPTVPQDFVVQEYATGFQRPRFMVEGPGEEVLLSDTVKNGSVYVLIHGEKKVLLSGLDQPYGLAFWKGYLYVGEVTSLKRYKYDAQTMTAGAGEEIVQMAGFDKGHLTRTVLFDDKHGKMYLALGSSGDMAMGDPEMRAAINRYNPDGTGHEIVASGLRNPIGLRFYPGTDQLWAAVQERDDFGGKIFADYFTSVKPGGFYGWPNAYLGPHEDPRLAGKRDDLVARTITPDIALEPHVAVLDFVFYTGDRFPKEYRDGAFLANHGSSSRSKRVGYSVSFIPFRHGKPSGSIRDFLAGPTHSPDQQAVWGRPVGLLQLRDGTLLVSDDGGKKVWQISYKGRP